MEFHSAILAPCYAKSHSIFGIAENLAGGYIERMSRDRSENCSRHIISTLLRFFHRFRTTKQPATTDEPQASN